MKVARLFTRKVMATTRSAPIAEAAAAAVLKGEIRREAASPGNVRVGG